MDGQSPPTQLSFDVGGYPPDTATIKVSGSLSFGSQLSKGEEVHVTVDRPDGEVIASEYGRVIGIGFKDKFDKHGVHLLTERSHTIKLGE